MFKQDSFVFISGCGHHELDADVLERINKLSNSSYEFFTVQNGVFADNKLDTLIPQYEVLANKNVVIMQSTYNLALKEELLSLIFACKYQYQAKSVTAILPFMLYRRQDHPERPIEIHRNLMMIKELKAVGLDNIVFIDIHSNITLENCHQEGIRAWNIDTSAAFRDFILQSLMECASHDQHCYVYSPDIGSIRRCLNLYTELCVGLKKNNFDTKILQLSVFPKIRRTTGQVEMITDEEVLKKIQTEFADYPIIFDDQLLQGAWVVMRDDEISTGGTANKVGRRLKELGVNTLLYCITHPVLAPGWKRIFFNNNPFSPNSIFFGNTRPRGYENSTFGLVTKVDVSYEVARSLLNIFREISPA